MRPIDPAELSPVERYRLLIGVVVPRPIAWLSTVDGQGRHNLAPFSFFNGITARPPTVMVSIGPRQPSKDSLRNLRETGEAVLHLPSPEQVAQVHQSGAEYRPGISEAEQLELELCASERVRPPRLAAAEIALECRMVQEVAIGDPPAAVCFLEILLLHLAEGLCGENGLPDPRRVRTAARLGDRYYLAGRDWPVREMGKPELPDELRLQRDRG